MRGASLTAVGFAEIVAAGELFACCGFFPFVGFVAVVIVVLAPFRVKFFEACGSEAQGDRDWISEPAPAVPAVLFEREFVPVQRELAGDRFTIRGVR